MEAMFEIGRETGTRSARLAALEAKGGCGYSKARSRGIPLSQQTEEQRHVTLQLRKNHKELFKALNELVAKFGLADKVRAGTIGLVSVGRPSVSAETDDCCFCRNTPPDMSGPDYCCSDNCQPCCAG